MKLKGKVALITGAASGIGREMARQFSKAGAKVAIADLAADQARETVEELQRAGGTAMSVAMDVTDEEQVAAGVAMVVSCFGGVDVLVSNAGIQFIKPLVDLDFGDWRRVLSVHVDGAFLTTRDCMREMIRQGRGGAILYLGSVHSFESSPLKAPYVTAKHALLGLARVVAREGAAHNIRSNVLCPGFVRTPLVERQIPEQANSLGIPEEDVVRNIMLRETVDGEFTTTLDVAQTAVFLAAFPGNALTGQSIVVSHGWHMH